MSVLPGGWETTAVLQLSPISGWPGWAELLSDVRKSFFGPPGLISLLSAPQTQAYQELLCVQCFLQDR